MEVMKQLRQREIRDLLGAAPRSGRSRNWQRALRDRGFRATQATISRDVAELGLIKSNRDGVQTYSSPGPGHGGREHRRGTAASAAARSARRRPRGRADARAQDPARLGPRHRRGAGPDALAEVVGSIAGDDTVFVVFADRVSMQRIRGRLIQLGR